METSQERGGMKAIFVDETGDLGFDFTKAGTSGYFLIAFLITDDPKTVQSEIKKIFRSMSKAERKHARGVLHAYYEKKDTRIRLLRKLSEKDIKIALMVFNKKKALITEDVNVIYNSMVTSLINRLYIDGHIEVDEEIYLTASQSNTNKRLNEQFKTVVLSESKPTSLKVEIKKPYDEKALQAVDFIAWSFGNKYETSESSYADIVKDKLIGEYSYYLQPERHRL